MFIVVDYLNVFDITENPNGDRVFTDYAPGDYKSFDNFEDAVEYLDQRLVFKSAELWLFDIYWYRVEFRRNWKD